MNDPAAGSAPLGVILAGGAASRMGEDKALVPFRGAPMIEWVAAALGPVCNDIVVVGRRGELAGLACIPDDRPEHRGPLAGLATALRHADDRSILLVAVDQPLVRAGTLGALRSHDDGRPAVPIDHGVRQILCAAYPASLAASAAAADAKGSSIQRLLAQSEVRDVPPEEWRSWGEDGRSWFSVDDRAALIEAERLFASG